MREDLSEEVIEGYEKLIEKNEKEISEIENLRIILNHNLRQKCQKITWSKVLKTLFKKHLTEEEDIYQSKIKQRISQILALITVLAIIIFMLNPGTEIISASLLGLSIIGANLTIFTINQKRSYSKSQIEEMLVNLEIKKAEKEEKIKSAKREIKHDITPVNIPYIEKTKTLTKGRKKCQK